MVLAQLGSDHFNKQLDLQFAQSFEVAAGSQDGHRTILKKNQTISNKTKSPLSRVGFLNGEFGMVNGEFSVR